MEPARPVTAQFWPWAVVTVFLLPIVWIWSALAGGATLYEGGDVTAGIIGCLIGALLVAAGLIARLVNRSSGIGPFLAKASTVVVLLGVAITAVTT